MISILLLSLDGNLLKAITSKLNKPNSPSQKIAD
jgi:hypothetical protein